MSSFPHITFEPNPATTAGRILIAKDCSDADIMTAYSEASDEVFSKDPIAYDHATDTIMIGKWELILTEGVTISANIVADDVVQETIAAKAGEISTETAQPPGQYAEGGRGETDVFAYVDALAFHPAQLTSDDFSQPPHTPEYLRDEHVGHMRDGGQTEREPRPQKQKKPKQNKFSAARQENLQRLVEEGVGSRAPAPRFHHNPRAVELLRKATENFVPTNSMPRTDGEDGKDFINTTASAITRLGKALDINAKVPFSYHDLGEFASVGAFWYYISSDAPDDSLRGLFGAACRNAGRRITTRPVEGFRTLIADATWAKINSDPDFVRAIVGNDLPYTCFYMREGEKLPQYSKIASWYVPIIEEIAKTLKAIRDTEDTTLVPDFGFLDREEQERPRGRPRYNENGNGNNHGYGERRGRRMFND